MDEGKMDTTAAPPGVRAIATRYNGIEFRSRLEARWAIFFDHLGVPWRYEFEGFETSAGLYLPDFWLPRQETWVEIKPIFEFVTGEVRAKCAAVSNMTGKRFVLFCDEVGSWLEPDASCSTPICFFPDDGEDFPYMPCVCGMCGKFGIEYYGRSERICRHHGPERDRGESSDHPRIVAAVVAAQAYRFWNPRKGA